MSWTYRTARYLFKQYFRFFHDLKITQDSPLPKGGAVIVANHLSFLDPPLVGVAFEEEIHALARSTLFKNPLFGGLLKRLNTHPVYRSEDGGGSLKHVLAEVETFLKEGKKILLFPEGKRSGDGTLQPIKSGAAMLALQAKVPLIPVWIEGTYEVWPKSSRLPKLSGAISCRIGTAIYPNFAAAYEKKQGISLLNQELERVFSHLAKKN